MRKHFEVLAVGVALGGAMGCSTSYDEPPSPRSEVEAFGTAVVALTNPPTDAVCVRITVAGRRTDVRSLALTPGKRAELELDSLPVGLAAFSAETFSAPCVTLGSAPTPSWYTEPVSAKVGVTESAHVALLGTETPYLVARRSNPAERADSHGP